MTFHNNTVPYHLPSVIFNILMLRMTLCIILTSCTVYCNVEAVGNGGSLLSLSQQLVAVGIGAYEPVS
jgi:hypothetical membrane protein